MSPKVLVCDLDNTLYDWVSYFVPSFYAMVDKTVELIDCDRDLLLDDLREVHKIYHDSEHPFALLETNTVKNHFKGKTKSEVFDALNPVFHTFNSSRKRTLNVYPGVHETLKTLIENNVILVAHTESKLFAAVDRLRRLDLTQYFSRIYCREKVNTAYPSNQPSNFFKDFPLNKIVELSHHQSKPDTSVLVEICNDYKISSSQAAYVGDSMTKDILMAKNAGVFAIWAAYGTKHPMGFYEKLVRVSHWTESDIKKEKELVKSIESIVPDYIARNSFSDILSSFHWK